MNHAQYGCVEGKHGPRCPFPDGWKAADDSMHIDYEEMGRQRAVIERGLSLKPQPSELEKLSVLRGEPGMCRRWDYSFDAALLPSTAHTKWTLHDWISFIGSNWFRKP